MHLYFTWQKIGNEKHTTLTGRRRSSLEDLAESLNSTNADRQQKYNPVSFRGERSRRKRFSINGHCYNLEVRYICLRFQSVHSL